MNNVVKLDRNDENVKRFTLLLPDEMHKNFKIYCIENNISMQNKILTLINECLKGTKEE